MCCVQVRVARGGRRREARALVQPRRLDALPGRRLPVRQVQTAHRLRGRHAGKQPAHAGVSAAAGRAGRRPRQPGLRAAAQTDAYAPPPTKPPVLERDLEVKRERRRDKCEEAGRRKRWRGIVLRI